MLGGLSVVISSNQSGRTSYSTGTISASASTRSSMTAPNGTFWWVGSPQCNIDSSVFFDSEKAGLTSGRCGEGKTPIEMRTQSTYAGYDFADTWEFEVDPSGELGSDGKPLMKAPPTLRWAH